jgi:autonomous glycyl radical cofactor GrcA
MTDPLGNEILALEEELAAAKAALAEALYTANQVKELICRMAERERDRDTMSEAYREKCDHLLYEVLRSNTAEAALAEAHELITALSRGGIRNSDLAVEVHGWLQANKRDACGESNCCALAALDIRMLKKETPNADK